MTPVKVLRIFADNYQFSIFDSAENPFELVPDYSDESVARGWTRTEHAISFATQAHLNDHRLDFFLGPLPAVLNADRASVHPLQLTSGCLSLYDTDETILAQVSAGHYAVVVAGYNLGQERSDLEDDLGDEQFLSHLEWERYELYLFKPEQETIDGSYPQMG